MIVAVLAAVLIGRSRDRRCSGSGSGISSGIRNSNARRVSSALVAAVASASVASVAAMAVVVVAVAVQ